MKTRMEVLESCLRIGSMLPVTIQEKRDEKGAIVPETWIVTWPDGVGAEVGPDGEWIEC